MHAISPPPPPPTSSITSTGRQWSELGPVCLLARACGLASARVPVVLTDGLEVEPILSAFLVGILALLILDQGVCLHANLAVTVALSLPPANAPGWIFQNRQAGASD
ncbi:unnamed protein product [Prorocentrum cordatum]|uniref:Uncharacterized protein n=1 Tax=Prorocentrum cordatum TaxID=2364126 RepID=A0ABN9V7M9_9DINO|nr:unnamed protein product [Polarella glacialis]